MSLPRAVTQAVKHINQCGVLLIFPHDNRRDPKSLWYQLHPRTKMRWEWDADGDQKVSDLWRLREQLSLSNQVVYCKWYRGRATVVAFDVFTALLRRANSDLEYLSGLSRTSQEILQFLEEDSPLSTKQIKKLADLQGKDNEASYNRAMKELWDRLLIVAYGEVDEGAFPSLAIGATRHIFESLWLRACELSQEDALATLEKRLENGSAFEKFWRSMERKWKSKLA